MIKIGDKITVFSHSGTYFTQGDHVWSDTHGIFEGLDDTFVHLTDNKLDIMIPIKDIKCIQCTRGNRNE